MPSARQRALDAIKVGDIICGISGNGNEKLLLVYAANETSFFARHVTTNTSAEFGRDGETKPVANGGSCKIASTATLPVDQYKVALALDQKVRTKARDAGYDLSKDEVQLILSYGSFYKTRPLPAE